MRINRNVNLSLKKTLLTIEWNKIAYLLFFFCIHISSSAQDPKTFDSIYDKTYKETAQKDLNRALAVADSLYRTSQISLYQIRSLILVARIYQQKEDLEKSVEYCIKAERLAVETGDYAWQARANGLLAGQYRMMGLNNKAKEYLEKALGVIPKIQDKEKANNTAGLLQQELAFCNMDGENHRKAISYLQKAAINFQQVADNKDFLLMTNERLLGQNYYHVKSYDTALAHFQKALDLSSGKPVHYIVGMIHKGMAETYLESGNLNEAKKHLDQAEKIANESQYLQLKDAVYAISTKYYATIKDKEKLAAAHEKKDSVVDELLSKRADLLDKTYVQLEERGVKAEAVNRQKSATIILLIILLFSAVSVFLIYLNKRRKKEQDTFKAILEQLKAREEKNQEKPGDLYPGNQKSGEEPSIDTSSKKDAIQPSAQNSPRIVMSAETEQKLLEGINKFENANFYLDKNLSLSSLATSLGTNNKYLSHVIKTHKKTDFNTYINELRVNYIIEKLNNNPELRQYKISVLAETAGFTSHSQFAAIFKGLKGISPSAFIRCLAAEEG